MGTHRGHTTLDPETTITVDDAEHTDLVRWGVWVDDKAKAKTPTKKDESAGEAPTSSPTDAVASDAEANGQEAQQ